MSVSNDQSAKWSLYGETFSGETLQVQLLGCAVGPRVGVAWVRAWAYGLDVIPGLGADRYRVLCGPTEEIGAIYESYQSGVLRTSAFIGREATVAIVQDVPVEALCPLPPASVFTNVVPKDPPAIPLQFECTLSVGDVGNFLRAHPAACMLTKHVGCMWGARIIPDADPTTGHVGSTVVHVSSNEAISEMARVSQDYAAKLPGEQIVVTDFPAEATFQVPTWFIVNAYREDSSGSRY